MFVLYFCCRGHFGEVRDCTDKKTSKRYIVKVTSPDIEESVHEFNILKGLRHETILCLLAAFSTPSAIFLIFEFVPGEHAAQRLSLRRRYSEESVAYIIRQVILNYSVTLSVITECKKY